MASYDELGLNKSLYRITLDENGVSELVMPNTALGNELQTENIGSGEIAGGIILVGGFMQSKNWVIGTSGWRLTPDSAEFNVGVSVAELHIPDEDVTDDSFHVATDGDAWWGATASDFASDNDNAEAYILKDGTAKFQNISVGGTSIQYQINDEGIFSFGDGSDGAAVFNGVDAVTGAGLVGSTYTLTRDVYYTSATISTGVTVKPAGYRMFGTGTLTLNGTALIERNGNAGGAGGNGNNATAGSIGVPDTSSPGTGGSAGSAGSALSDGYLKGSVAGQAGVTGRTGSHNGESTCSRDNSSREGSAGTNTSNSIGDDGSAGGDSGQGGEVSDIGGNFQCDFTGGDTGGAGGVATASNVKLIANWHLATLLDVSSTGATVKFNNSAGSGSGAGGGGGSGTAFSAGGGGGGSGGSGSSGGIIAIYFRNIVVGASASITATGGAGGAGGTGGDGNGTSLAAGGGGGGAGGAGGNGGQIILTYNTFTNSGTVAASGGVGGAGGTGGAGYSGTGTGDAGESGDAGNAGSVGTVRQFQLSL